VKVQCWQQSDEAPSIVGHETMILLVKAHYKPNGKILMRESMYMSRPSEA